MRKTALPLLFLALASLARAQTTTIKPDVCRLIWNCQLWTSDGNRVWVDNPYFVAILDPAGTVRPLCNGIVAYHFQYLSSPPPGVKNPAHVPFTFHVECDSIAGTITVDEQGYGFYWRGGGGKGGGGAGTYYAVTSGTVTLN